MTPEKMQTLGVIGTWAAALGQFAVAAMVYWYTQKSSEGNATKMLGEMLNEFNALAASSPELMTAHSTLANVITDVPTDALIFSYLNCTRAHFHMRKKNLISSDHEQAQIQNAAYVLRNVARDKLMRYLNRGYEEDFRRSILAEYDRTKP